MCTGFRGLRDLSRGIRRRVLQLHGIAVRRGLDAQQRLDAAILFPSAGRVTEFCFAGGSSASTASPFATGSAPKCQ